jgi:hypothetical protein
MQDSEEHRILRLLSDRPQSWHTLTNALGRRGRAKRGRETLHELLLRMRQEGKIAFDIQTGFWRPTHPVIEAMKAQGVLTPQT